MAGDAYCGGFGGAADGNNRGGEECRRGDGHDRDGYGANHDDADCAGGACGNAGANADVADAADVVVTIVAIASLISIAPLFPLGRSANKYCR